MMKNIFIASLVAIPASFGIYSCSQVNVSQGIRSGTVVKLSHKGLIWKTYEGSLMIGTGQTAIPNYWDFTVSDPIVVSTLERAINENGPVILHYNQIACNWPWQGETDYFIEKVEFRQ